MDHRDDSTFSFDPEKLTHAKPLERKKSRNSRVIVMRRGAAILSDPFAKRKGAKRGSTSAPTAGEEAKSASSSCKVPQQDVVLAPPSGAGSGAPVQRPASLIVSPPSVTAPTPSTPEDKGVAPKEGHSAAPCEPCAATPNRCCQCQCHERGQEALRPSTAPKKACEESSKPYLRLANNPSHKQPSLDDSGVVGDHEGGDTISLQPQMQQVRDFFGAFLPEEKGGLLFSNRSFGELFCGRSFGWLVGWLWGMFLAKVFFFFGKDAG